MASASGDGIPFSKDEFGRRMTLVKKAMENKGIDLLLVCEPSNIYYLIGYEAWSFYVFQALVVHREVSEPIWVGRFMDAASAHRTTYLGDEGICPYGDEYVQSAERDPVDFLVSTVVERCPAFASVGVEMGAYYYSARAHRRLTELLPKARFIDAELLVNWVRIIKSDAEIALMREAGKIADAIIARAVEVIAPGVRECDVAGAVYNQMMSGTPDYGGVYTTSPPHLCAGERTAEPHAPWTDSKLKKGTPVNLETAGCRRRYHAPISRTIFLGDPPDSYRRLAGAVIEGLEETLGAVRPGATCADVQRTWQDSIARHGLHKEARLGYTIGIGFPPTWGERTASLRAGDHTVLEPGMGFHVMSGLWLDQIGVTITQSLVVTGGGYEALTASPRQLIVKQ